jgi:uracil-DNA glycosylase
MVLEEIWQLVERHVFPLPSTPSLFSHYRDDDPDLDMPHGHQARRANLRNYLESFPSMPEVLVVGESPGLWGARFSGVPFTSERQFVKREVPFPGRPTSLAEPLVRAARRHPCASASSTIFWRAMAEYHPDFLAWYLVMPTPHAERNRLAKRAPAESDFARFADVNRRLLALLSPRLVIAVGSRTAQGLEQLGVDFITVHHPVHDAHGEFVAGMTHALRKRRAA